MIQFITQAGRILPWLAEATSGPPTVAMWTALAAITLTLIVKAGD